MPPPAFIYAGINFVFPAFGVHKNDNILCQGQSVQIPRGYYSSMCTLASSQSDMATGNFTIHYADDVHPSSVLVPPWWSWPYPAGGDIVFPYILTNKSIDYNRSSIFKTCHWLDPKKELIFLTLPKIADGPESGPRGQAVGTRLHIFSLTMIPAHSKSSNGATLQVKHARTTQKWIEGTDTQIVEVVIKNLGGSFVLRNSNVSVTVEAPGIQTVKRATIKRLAPGDQVEVEIGVVNSDSFDRETSKPSTIIVEGVGIATTKYTFNANYGIQQYSPTYESLYSHESPNWFNNAKFGIFVHWGPYAVPAWGNVGKNETYAEWYVQFVI
jgi:alpha-L-fucosidase